MILPILIYLAVGATYTVINIKNIIATCKELDEDLNYDNGFVISLVFIVFSVIYPQFIWASIIDFLNRKK